MLSGKKSIRKTININMVTVNDNGYRGFSAVNHGENMRDTASPIGDNRTTMVYPRLKFTYLAEFVINPNAISAFRTDLSTHLSSGRLYATLESIELPKAGIEFETIRSYNKLVEVPITYKFEPSSMVFQDDNSSMAAALWLEYQSFYLYGGDMGKELSSPTSIISNLVRQGNSLVGTSVRSLMDKRPSLGVSSRYSDSRHFFNEIIIYDLGSDPSSINVYHYVNPVITTFSPDGMDYQNGNDYKKITMNFKYEYFYFEVGQNASDITQWFDTELGIDAGVAFADVAGHVNMTAQAGSVSSDFVNTSSSSNYTLPLNAVSTASNVSGTSTTGSTVATGSATATSSQTLATPQMASTWATSGISPLVNGVPTTSAAYNTTDPNTLLSNPQVASSASALQADLNAMGLGVI